jgi:radical SAM superfamily enzyme YgiQ (UPF0313 family)
VVLIKPSRYDDDGYVIQWRKSALPSNTLAQLYGLVQDCGARAVLGADVDIDILAYDETNVVLPIKRLIRWIGKAGGGMVGLVGVQSNQFPRAVDIARRFREAGIPVVIGGFHVSGCLSMLRELPGDIRAAMDAGITMFAGEAEGRLDELLRAAAEDRLEPLYNHMNELPSLAGAVAPFLPAQVIRRTAADQTTLDAGRGCPYQCSFCTIINVQGRVSRRRSVEDIEAIIRANVAQGISSFFITDDNFARNKGWEAILDRIIELREKEGMRVRLLMQVDTLAHRTPGFIDKAARAGCKKVFIGLENINPEALLGAKKRQNKVSEYRRMLQAWKNAGVLTYAGYIIGFPPDTPQSIARDIGIVQRELPVDLVEFFVLTPLPGSEDHRNLVDRGAWLDPDMNRYDTTHVTTTHPRMSAEEWQDAYRDAWRQYYRLDHVETILRRVAAKGMSVGNTVFLIIWFFGCVQIENIHPLEGGWLRRKRRRQRRPTLARENPLVFYPRRCWEVLDTHLRLARLVWTYARIRRRVKSDPGRLDYTDLALAPVAEDDGDRLELMQVFGQGAPGAAAMPTVTSTPPSAPAGARENA